ncbi:putative disease resistance RPP13-like protein 1 [Vicia villosa]|uniref:putative disease resistance RPP13-like protein 1 n=1 Tax=Vicia villosa TaxID=3911 RepID=UPI00273BFDE3|nr:putative disease resistance RPP13-like protein 1 [Vicia villosa]
MDSIQREKFASLSNSVNLLLESIFSDEQEDYIWSKKADLPLLEKTLVDLQYLLRYAKNKLILSQAINNSLDMLRRAVFQVSNLLHENQISGYDAALTPNQLKNNSRLSFFTALIKSKTDNLNQIFHGLSSVGDDDSSIYGRDYDIQKLKHLLLSNSSDGDGKIRVISIVGMGGIGKTALAKLLYNLPQVKAKFELKLWADFSNDVDDLSIFENILRSITSQTKSNTTSDINTVYPNFLLVLDGVWDARFINWTLLMDLFNARETGSRVIITTRDDRVAMSMQTFVSVHYMRPLKVEDCLSLLAKHAFKEHYYHGRRFYLEVIDRLKKGMQVEFCRRMAKKCEGLPLAAVEHGDILCISFDADVCNYVQESHARETAYEVLASLKLSYNFLSDPLKQCFQYCSIFPKKSILEKKMVVQLWIAAGLLESSSTNQEKVGEEYFDELVSRSLIHRRSNGVEERNFGMHNFIHDLATEVSSPEVSSSYHINMHRHNLDDRMQNFSYNRGTYDSYDKFDKLYRVKGLRTFLAFPLQEQLPLGLLSNKVVHDLLPTMKQLRMLSLSSYKSIVRKLV